MSETEPPDVERLRAALARLGDEPGWPEIDAERVFSALHGDLSAEERRAVVDELVRNPRAAAAWRLARELAPFDAAFDAAQGKPFDAAFDAAQGKPFDAALDAAQGKPFDAALDAAQGKPFDAALDAAQGKPFDAALDAAQGKPFDAAFDAAQGKPFDAAFDDAQGRPLDAAEGRVEQPAHAPARPPAWAWMSIAAMLLLVVAAAWQFQLWRSDPPVYRSAEPRSIASLLPAGDRLSREQPVLRWTALDGARYRVRVLSPELDLLNEAEDLAAPEYRLPPDVLERIPAGGRMLWQVEARVPGTAAVVSPTFSVQLE